MKKKTTLPEDVESKAIDWLHALKNMNTSPIGKKTDIKTEYDWVHRDYRKWEARCVRMGKRLCAHLCPVGQDNKTVTKFSKHVCING